METKEPRMNTEESKYIANDKYVTVSRGKDCWYIVDNDGVVIATRISKKSVDDSLREGGYQPDQSR
jgi:hypothetical protein